MNQFPNPPTTKHPKSNVILSAFLFEYLLVFSESSQNNSDFIFSLLQCAVLIPLLKTLVHALIDV